MPACASPGNARAASSTNQTLIADRQSNRVRRLLLLTSAIVFFDTLFFAALTPLLPRYAETLGLGKTGAGVLAAAYPAGAFVGAIPSGIVASRAGVKPTVVIGLTTVAASAPCSSGSRANRGSSTSRVSCRDSRAPSPGPARSPGSSPPPRRGDAAASSAPPSQRRSAARSSARCSAVSHRSPARAGPSAPWAIASLGLVAWAASTPSARPEAPQPLRMLGRAFRDPRVLGAFWFVVLPALLFGAVSVLAPLRLSVLGFGSVAIGAVFLVSGAFEVGEQHRCRAALRPARPALPDSHRARGIRRRGRNLSVAGQRLRARRRRRLRRPRVRDVLHARA